MRYSFAFDDRFRLPLRGLGITESTAYADLGRDHMLVKFGLWTVAMRYDNIDHLQASGPYAWYRTIGARLSLRDRGLTFGTNADAGVCVFFKKPVTGFDPLGFIKHPALTLTLADIGGFMNGIEDRYRVAV
ncbi:MAG: hypothetical protein ABR548_00165 [Actinomycetota bacterium]|nr:hypothetical protein [Actinomycetota bacterium]